MQTRKNGDAFLYQKIRDDYLRQIRDGSYQTGDKIPSEKEIADAYNVSRVTVTRALADLTQEGYISRVQGKGSFVRSSERAPEASAERPVGAPGETRKIGMIIPECTDSHSGAIVRGVIETLPFPDYFIDIALNRTNAIETYALNHFLRQDYAGMILFPADSEFFSDIILRMHLNRFPFVLIDRSMNGLQCNTVITDNQAGAHMAMEHLYSLGHRGIVFASGVDLREQITSIRYAAFQSYLAEKHIPASYSDTFYSICEDEDCKITLLEKIRARQVTAVFASNANTALRIYHLVRDAGLRIPQDVSLLSFDDVYECPLEEGGFFTHIDQSSYEMGRRAASILRVSFENGDNEYQRVVLKPCLVAGRSTARI